MLITLKKGTGANVPEVWRDRIRVALKISWDGLERSEQILTPTDRITVVRLG